MTVEPEMIIALAAYQHWHSLNDEPRKPDDPPPPPPAKAALPPSAPAGPVEHGPGLDPKNDPAKFVGPRMVKC